MTSSLEIETVARKGISYVRFSGKRQEAGHSQQRQIEMAEAAALEEGVLLDWTLSLSDKGLSGFRGENWKNGDLGKFLDLVDAGIIPVGSVLIIERVNRLSRLPWMEQVELWKQILRRGIIIRTCEPPSRYSAENMNELSVGCPVVLLMMLAHHESKQKSDWIKAVWREKKKQARAEGVPHGRMRPAWIDVVTKPHPKDPDRIVTTGYQLNQERAEIVRFIFAEATAGSGLSKIGRVLREKGVPSFQRSNWTPACIRNILESRTVMGEYQQHEKDASGKRLLSGKPIPNYYPAVITEDQFHAAQRAKRGRRGKGGRQGDLPVNLFTHLVFDADTGLTLHSMTQVQHGQTYRYLASKNRNSIVPYPIFEDTLLDTLSNLKARDVDGRHEEDALTAKANAVQKEFRGLKDELEELDLQIRELPPARWPRRVVARMSELEEMIEAKKEGVGVWKLGRIFVHKSEPRRFDEKSTPSIRESAMQEALNANQENEAQQLAQAFAQAAADDFLKLARLLVASGQNPFGQTEFTARDILLRTGVKVYEQYLTQKKTATKEPA